MIKLHLCCGARNFGPDWYHIDKDPKHKFAHNDNILELPFPDNSVDLIYCSHGLAYLNQVEGQVALNHWYNKLAPGGTLRLSTTDIDKIMWLYFSEEEKFDIKNLLGPVFGQILLDNGESIYHKTIYNKELLIKKLTTAGFRISNIHPWDWRKVDHGHIDDQSQAYWPHMNKATGTQISLNIEAVK